MGTKISMEEFEAGQLSDQEMMDAPFLEDGSFGQILTAEMAQAGLTAAAAGAGGVLLASVAIPRVPFLARLSTPIKGAITALAGLLIGRLLWAVNRDAAVGVIGSMGGLGIATLVGGLANIPVGLGEFDQEPEEEELLGLGQPVIIEEDELAQLPEDEELEQELSQVPVLGPGVEVDAEEEELVGVEAEEEEQLASFLG